nr:multicopper oxidase family protein [Pseudonocardia sp. C8]
MTSAEPTAGAAGPATPVRRARWRTALAVLATLAVLVPVGWLWWDSRMPAGYSAMDMGTVDLGGGPGTEDAHGGHAGHPAVGVPELRDATTGPAAVTVTLTARREVFRLPSGRTVDGYTLNGTSPGPEIRTRQGELVEIRLRNESVPDGVTLHWHGVDVPNGDDGVAGITQDAVRPGGEFVYRFRAPDSGTYWYHSHQVSHVQVRQGLFGALVVEPPAGAPEGDVTAVSHTFAGARTVNGQEDGVIVPAAAGERVRVRVINSDEGAVPAWVTGAGFRLRAVDGAEVRGPAPVAGLAVSVPAGGRADLEVEVPAGGARIEVGGGAALVLAPPGSAGPPPSPRPRDDLDLLTYGAPAPIGFDPDAAQRRFDYVIGRRPGFVDGVPGVWWTVNGRMWPDVPMYVVDEGDVVRMRVRNDSSEVHPMHLHGHHVVVLARDGAPATGSPWWTDSLDVAPGVEFDVAFVADNPGLWADHCHNLEHAKNGLIAHLMYRGVDTPFRIGTGNHPD